MEKKWDASGYATNFNFVHEYGQDVLNLIDFDKSNKILDLGCGNGALTKRIADMGKEVIGLDGSKEMLEIAKKQFPELTFIHADATNFKLEEKVDTIFSNAVFHWISDQDKLLDSVYNNLLPNGQLVCEFGGSRCAEAIHSTLEHDFEKRGLKYLRTFYFPTIGEYSPILEKHGFKVTYAVLFDRFTKQVGDNGLENWIRMFNMAPFNGMEENTINEIINNCVNSLRDKLYVDGSWYVDYVRIRIKATKQ